MPTPQQRPEAPATDFALAAFDEAVGGVETTMEPAANADGEAATADTGAQPGDVDAAIEAALAEEDAAEAAANPPRESRPPRLDLSKLPPSVRAVVEHELTQLRAERAEATELKRKAGKAVEFAGLLDDVEKNDDLRQMLHDWYSSREGGGAPAPGQAPAPARRAPQALRPITEDFEGLDPEQLAVLQKVEARGQAREQAIVAQIRDAVVQMFQQHVGPIQSRINANEADRQWSSFVGAVPDWDRVVSAATLKQRQSHAPHVAIDEHFWAEAGPKIYAERNALRSQLRKLLAGRPHPPTTHANRRADVDPIVDPNDWGTAFDAAFPKG